MFRLRAVIAVLAVALLLGGWLHGDEKSASKVKGQLPPNWSKLGLTDKQKESVYRAQADYRDKIDSLEQQLKKLKDEERAELLKVLTDEQKNRLREILAGKAGLDKEEKKPNK